MMKLQIGDYVRFGDGPYDIFPVNEFWNDGATIGTVTVHGMYTELPTDRVELVDRDWGIAARRVQIARWNAHVARQTSRRRIQWWPRWWQKL